MNIICFCHIRWNFVYQRPQHLMYRFAAHDRVYIVEEPLFDQPQNKLQINPDKENDNLFVVNLFLKKQEDPASGIAVLKTLLLQLLSDQGISRYITWYYSPMPLEYSDHFLPRLIVYDCMDELSAFKFAPPSLKKLEAVLLSKADVVFTGGQSLYEAKKHLHHNIHPFPSSIDKAHFGKARLEQEEPSDQQSIPHPRFGFYGVIDERFNISLIDELSALKPDWHFVLIGPVVKIDPETLPRRDNIHYLGPKDYSELPSYLASWDIATLPFAINDSTKYISPTKTPEYLAGGKPVISASIRDVVDSYRREGLVRIADTADEFIFAAGQVLGTQADGEWLQKVDSFLANNSWNKTWQKMNSLINEALNKKSRTLPNKENIYV